MICLLCSCPRDSKLFHSEAAAKSSAVRKPFGVKHCWGCPTGNKDCPSRALGSPALEHEGSTSTQQHSCWSLREFLGSIFFFRTCLVLCAVLPLQWLCSGLPCFSMWLRQSSSAAAATGQPRLQTSQPSPFPAHSISSPAAASLPCFNADYRAGNCQEMPCFKCFLQLKNFQRDSSEREREALRSIILGRN